MASKPTRKNFGSEDRVKAVRNMPCLICGKLPSENHHVITRGAGGSKRHIVPLCAEHHQDHHTMGSQTFQRKYDIDLLLEAEKVDEHLSSYD